MSVRSKKILSLMAYYTLFIITTIMAVATILFALNRELPNWASIVYVIWACAVILTLAFDIYFSLIKRMKFYTGISVYILSVASIIVTAILYITRSTLTAGLTSTFMPIFAGVAAVVLSTSVYMIATFVVGESVVEHKSALKSMKEKQN